MTKYLPSKSLVLYADDDTDDLELLKEVFDDYSTIIDLVTFKDGWSLLNYLESLDPLQVQPGLVILDINMPLLNGKQTLQKLRNLPHFADIPAILFTTSTLPHEADFARRYKAGFLTKPVHQKHIQLLLDQMMEYCGEELKAKIRKHRGH